MTLSQIYQQLGWNVKYENEVKKFNNRILLTVDNFHSKVYKGGDYEYIYPSLIKEFAFLLGESEYYGYSLGEKNYFELIRFFEGEEDTFLTNIKNLTLLLEAARKTLVVRYSKYYTFLLGEIKKVFEITPVDIGYLFTGETIIKKGATALDEKLIIENLTWLADYPNAKQLFENSLKHYLTKHYQDAITNAYSSLESLAKTYLSSDKRLDADEIKNNLVKNLGLEDDWKRLLHYYCNLAHEFSSRHGKKESGEKSDLPLELTEFYIYVTGTFIRLIIQRINSKSINT